MKQFKLTFLVVALMMILSNVGWGQVISENFQSWSSKGSYTGTLSQSGSGGTWTGPALIVAPTGTASGTGSTGYVQFQSVNGILTLPNIVSGGIGTITIQARVSGTNGGFSVEKSINGGTWSNVQTFTTSSTTGIQFQANVNDASANIQLRINNTGGSSGRTLYVYDCVVTTGAIPSITISSPSQITAGTTNQSATNVILSQFQAAVTTSNATLNSIAFTSAGTYVAGDLSNFKLWYNGTSNTFGSAVQLGSTITTSLGTGGHTFSSLSQAINSGATGYLFITCDISAGPVNGNTINIDASPTLTFASGTPTGTITAGGAQTISVLTPGITLSSPSPSVAAGNVLRNSAKNLIYKFNTAIITISATINTVNFTTGGSYSSSDVSKFQLWFKSGSDDFSTAVQIGTDITSTLGIGSHSFSSLTQAITAGTTGYFYITTNVNAGATVASTINVSAIATSDLTFASGTLSGTTSAGQDQTIATPSITLSSSNPAVTAGNINQSSSKNNIYAFTLAMSNGQASLNQLSFTTTGTYTSSDVTKFQLWYNSTNTFGTATQLGSDIITNLQAGAHTFTGLSQLILNSATGYFWITTDVSASGNVGNTLQISAITTSDITFDAGILSGTASDGGLQTISAIIYTFRSKSATGNWNDVNAWESSPDGTNWTYPALTTPGAINTVYIQSGHIVTLTQNESCNDLHIAKGNASGNTALGKIALQTYTLSVNGKLRNYWAAVGTVPGTNFATYSSYPFTGTTGKVSIVGNTRNLTNTGEWGASISTPTTGIFPIEFNLNSNQTLTLNTSIKATSINFVTGTVDMLTNVASCDNGTVGLGDITISSSATVISSADPTSGTNVFQRTGTSKAGSLTVNGHLTLKGANPQISMNSIAFNGTVEYAGGTQTLAILVNGGATPNTYTNLVISGSGTKTLSYTPTNVSGDLTISGGILSLGANTLSLDGNINITSPDATKMISLDDGTNLGTLKKKITALGSYSFPVGDLNGTAEYSPANLNFTAWSSLPADYYLSLNLQNTKFSSNSSTSSYLKRYWTFTPTSVLSNLQYNIDLTFVDADVFGTKSEIILGKYSGSTWLEMGAPTGNTFAETGVPSFSTYTGAKSGTFPVTLAALNSAVIGRSIKLNWTTSSETNNTGFDVERMNIADNNWSKISFVSGHGTVNTPTNYSFEDRNLQTGKYKYRLKQIDNNGNFEYFALNGEVEIGVPKKFDLSQNYPNPFNPVTKINFDLPENGLVNLRLYDMLGREVATLVNEVRTAGYYTVNFDASKLSSGIYFYRMNAGKFSSIKKMAVIK